MNLPNRITLARIALIPLMVAAYYVTALSPANALIAAAIFAVAAATDFLDGYIARKTNQVTNMGKFLDPIADKVLVAAALFMLAGSAKVIPSPYIEIGSMLIIARELIIGGFRQVAAAANVIISADKSGKLKAVFQDAAIILLLTAEWLGGAYAGSGLYAAVLYVSYAVFGIAVILTVYSGINYIVKNKSVLSMGK